MKQRNIVDRLPQNPVFLVIRNSSLGNAIMDSPIFPWLKKQWPTAKTVAVFDPVSAQLFEAEGSIDKIIVLPYKAGWRRLMKVRKEIAVLKPDVSIHLKTGVRYELLALLARCPIRIGFKLKGSPQYLTHRVSKPVGVHASQFAKDLARILIPDAELDTPKLRVPEESFREADQIRNRLDLYLVLHPGGGTIGSDNWNHRLYAEVLDKLARPTIVIGSVQEQETFRKTCDLPHVHFAGKTSIRTVAGLIASSRVFIGNDSGPAHIAEALDTPAIIVYQSNDNNYIRWRPLNPTTLTVFAYKTTGENVESILSFINNIEKDSTCRSES